jgi:replicative DNA helicase
MEAKRIFDGIPMRQIKRTGMKLSALRSLARREASLLARQGVKLGLLTFDHVGLLAPDGRTNGDYEAQSQIARGMKELAGELGVPVLALIQLSRKVEERDDKRPQQSDLRASGQWEENADTIMLAYREAYYAQKEREPVDNGAPGAMVKWADWDRRRKSTDLELILAKTRDGEGGDVRLWTKVGHHAVRGIEPRDANAFDFSAVTHPSQTDGLIP